MFPYKSYNTYVNKTEYTGQLDPMGLKRINNETKKNFKPIENMPNIYNLSLHDDIFIYQEVDMTKLSFMIIGNKDTP